MSSSAHQEAFAPSNNRSTEKVSAQGACLKHWIYAFEMLCLEGGAVVDVQYMLTYREMSSTLARHPLPQSQRLNGLILSIEWPEHPLDCGLRFGQELSEIENARFLMGKEACTLCDPINQYKFCSRYMGALLASPRIRPVPEI